MDPVPENSVATGGTHEKLVLWEADSWHETCFAVALAVATIAVLAILAVFLAVTVSVGQGLCMGPFDANYRIYLS